MMIIHTTHLTTILATFATIGTVQGSLLIRLNLGGQRFTQCHICDMVEAATAPPEQFGESTDFGMFRKSYESEVKK